MGALAGVSGLGMEPQHWLTLVFGALGLALQAGVLAVGFTWKLATVKEALSEDIISHRDEVKDEMAADRRIVGEALQALRQKINDVELEGAKNYVRRESWHQAMNQLQTQLQAADKAAEERVLRIESKLDRLTERISEPSQRGRG